MRTLKLIRHETSEEGTFGELYNERGDHMFYTAELPKYAGDPDKENERQTDCIPVGTYKASIYNSPKHGRVYQLEKVPGRSNIQIHVGNYAGDRSKGFKCNVEGCILLGKSFGVMSNQKAVGSSKVAIAEFMEQMAGEPFMLDIEEKYA